MALKQAMSVTDAAAERIKALLAKRGKPSVGIRIGVRSRGCSGLSYTLEYADEKGKFDEIVEDKGVTILNLLETPEAAGMAAGAGDFAAALGAALRAEDMAAPFRG